MCIMVIARLAWAAPDTRQVIFSLLFCYQMIVLEPIAKSLCFRETKVIVELRKTGQDRKKALLLEQLREKIRMHYLKKGKEF